MVAMVDNVNTINIEKKFRSTEYINKILNGKNSQFK